MSDAFGAAVDDYASSLSTRYAEQLEALYLIGSLTRDEAAPGISDVNLLGVFRDELPDDAEHAAWHDAARRELEARHEGIRWDDGGSGAAVEPLFTFAALSLAAARLPDAGNDPHDALLELHWGGRLLWGDEIRGSLPPCLPPRLVHARAWSALAEQELAWAEANRQAPRLAGHRAAKAALRWCLAVCVVEGQGFTLDSALVATRLQSRYPEWETWTQEFVRARVDPPTRPEHLGPYLETARILGEWATTILHTIGVSHHLRC